MSGPGIAHGEPTALEALASADSPIHRLDPRAKLLTTLVMLALVLSFPRYEVGGLLPFAAFPAFMVLVADLPLRPLLIRLAWVAPFALAVGMFNPLLDREVLVHVGEWGVSGGWLSFASIVLRFLLAVGSVLVLVATTGVPSLAAAAGRLGAPRVLVTQIVLLYRYLFLLAGEARRMARAHAFRAPDTRAPRPRVFAGMVGQLLLRALERGRRVHRSMLARGFDGEVRVARPLRKGGTDILFVAGWCAVFALLRFSDAAGSVGELVLGVVS